MPKSRKAEREQVVSSDVSPATSMSSGVIVKEELPEEVESWQMRQSGICGPGIPVFMASPGATEEFLLQQMSSVGTGIMVVADDLPEEGKAPEGYETEGEFPTASQIPSEGKGLQEFILNLDPAMEFSEQKEAIAEAVKNIASLAEKEVSEGNMAAFVNYVENIDENFHRYSFMNSILIQAQLHAADVDIADSEFEWQQVMGRKQWWDSTFQRYTKKGALPLSIYIPLMSKVPDQDSEGNAVLDAAGNQVFHPVLRGFRVGHVYHAVDTLPKREKDPETNRYTGAPVGIPLPEPVERPPWPLAQGDAQELLDKLKGFAEKEGYHVDFYESTSGERGFTDASKKIAVATVCEGVAMSTEEQALVLAHELAHQHLQHTGWSSARRNLPRNIKELEAETVAATVCHKSDLHPTYYYLANWGKKNVKTNILQSLDSIASSALWLLNGVMGEA